MREKAQVVIKRKTDVMKAGKSSKRVRASSPPPEAVVAAPEDTVSRPADAAVMEAVALLPECTARNAEALRAALLNRLEAPGSVDVDVGAVERIDTVCLQLLCAFVRERNKHGRTTAWRGRSDVLVQAAALLGLGGTLAFGDAG